MDILEKITRLRLERNWTEYELAERSGLTQSTISSWYRKKLIPSIPSLEHICDAFGITLSQFFSEETEIFSINAEQKEKLDKLNRLTKEQEQTLFTFLDSMIQ